MELNLDFIRGDETPLEMIRIAYGMEQSLGAFYRSVRSATEELKLMRLLDRLISAEEDHKQYLLDRHNDLDSSKMDKTSFESLLSSNSKAEGGFDLEQLLRQSHQYAQSVSSLLDFSMMLETQSLDLYLRFASKMESETSKDLLYRIGDEEKIHLQELGRFRDGI